MDDSLLSNTRRYHDMTPAISRVILEKAQDQDKAVELATLRREGSILQGHPDMKRCPGIDISTGSLGQGLSAAVGMALCGKGDEKYYRAFCLVGDGESNEGQIWEALETAFKYRLDNLVILLDQNSHLVRDLAPKVVIGVRLLLGLAGIGALLLARLDHAARR